MQKYDELDAEDSYAEESDDDQNARHLHFRELECRRMYVSQQCVFNASPSKNFHVNFLAMCWPYFSAPGTDGRARRGGAMSIIVKLANGFSTSV